MVIGHNAETAKFILTGNSIEDLEKGLAEIKRQIANGITFSVCYGGDTINKSDFEKEYDSEYSDDCDCDDEDWDIYEFDHEEDYDPCEDCEEDCSREVAEEEANDAAVDEAVNAFIKVIKDILEM